MGSNLDIIGGLFGSSVALGSIFGQAAQQNNARNMAGQQHFDNRLWSQQLVHAQQQNLRQLAQRQLDQQGQHMAVIRVAEGLTHGEQLSAVNRYNQTSGLQYNESPIKARLSPKQSKKRKRKRLVAERIEKEKEAERVIILDRRNLAVAEHNRWTTAALVRGDRRRSFLARLDVKLKLFVYGLLGVSNYEIIRDIKKSDGWTDRWRDHCAGIMRDFRRECVARASTAGLS